MSEGGAESGKQPRPPHSQQGRSPIRQPPQQQQHPPVGSSTAHQVAGYIMPPQQQQQRTQPQQMQYSSASGGYGVYPQQQAPNRPHPPVGPLHAQQPPPHYAAAAAAGMAGQLPPQAYTVNMPAQQQPQQHALQAMQHEPYIQPRVGRLPADRPIMKLSVGLIETYKQINEVSYGDELLYLSTVLHGLLLSHSEEHMAYGLCRPGIL